MLLVKQTSDTSEWESSVLTDAEGATAPETLRQKDHSAINESGK